MSEANENSVPETVVHDVVMQRIGELIRTQDNRATSDPIFIVQRRKRIYGLDTDYAEDTCWIDDDGDEADSDMELELSVKVDCGESTEGWREAGYMDQWEFVTACFTEQGCKDYIAANGHNLGETRIYAASAYRNSEFIAVREFLKSV